MAFRQSPSDGKDNRAVMGPIGIVGLGVVGGTIAGTLAELGIQTRGYDRYLPIGKLEALGDCRLVFLCVPTPGADDGTLDLTEVWSAVRDLASHLRPGTPVVIKSTVPPGTTGRLGEAFPELEFAVVPEFLVATRTLETFTRPDRVVIGARSGVTAAALVALMSHIAPSAPPVIMTPLEAELIKLCSNAMLAAKVAMANELADVCAHFGVPWPRVQAVVGLDRRVGPDHLTVTPERGFGGACLPKDVDGLIAASVAIGYDPTVLRKIAEFNRHIRRISRADAVANLT